MSVVIFYAARFWILRYAIGFRSE